ncbi:THAP domain-containing protein 1 isoform X3 [Chanodichthys erythropterus]
MKRRNFKPTKYSNICSQHFTRDCFKRECNNRVLKDNAVPSLFSFSKIQAASLEDAFSPDMDFPLSLPLSDAEETAVVRPSETEPEPNPDLHASACVSCDHNYTVEDTVQQKRRIEQLQEQLEKLRKRLKTVQQKCRRQERQLERYRAVSQIRKTGKKDVTPGESYVILPREMYDVLKGIETIGAL